MVKALEEGISLRRTPDAGSRRGRRATARARRSRSRRRWAKTASGAPTARCELPARTVFIAAGTQPNTMPAREHPAHFQLDGRYFQAAATSRASRCKPAAGSVQAGRRDVLHRARARRPLRQLLRRSAPVLLRQRGQGDGQRPSKAIRSSAGCSTRMRRLERSATPTFFAALSTASCAGHGAPACMRLTPTIVEVIVHAPAAARKLRARAVLPPAELRDALRAEVDGTRLTMEGIALTGAWVDPRAGPGLAHRAGDGRLVGSVRPARAGRAGGADGADRHAHARSRTAQTVILAGGGLGNAVLFSIGLALARAPARTVLYFAGYRKRHRPLQDRGDRGGRRRGGLVLRRGAGLRAAAARRTEPSSATSCRRCDAYATGALGEQPIAFADADRIIAIGSDRMMAGGGRGAARRAASRTSSRTQRAIGSINSPMQCMMKEICAQCLQPHRDPATGKTSYVFSCFNQDQPLDAVVFEALETRLAQNGVQEKLTAQWVLRCRERAGAAV